MEQPPNDTPMALKSYLTRTLTKLDNELKLQRTDKHTSLPGKPIVGNIYYFSNAILPSITTEGYWGYKSTGWVLLG